MDQNNLTLFSYFVIKGISDIPEQQTPIFLLVLLIYLIVLGGNMTILLLICLDPHLHTPMYFFLGNLSLLDMLSTTGTLHPTLVTFITGDNTVYFLGCMSQMFIFSFLAENELFLLTAMSYDRYVAICNRSSTGRSKAFYTCSSHLTVVLLLYMTLICQYLRPVSIDSLESNKLFSLFNTAIVPMLNPLIYSLKNKDVKSALRRQLKLFKNIV
ncbi:olfactory receptor 5G3-like [Discoglossus pictus]